MAAKTPERGGHHCKPGLGVSVGHTARCAGGGMGGVMPDGIGRDELRTLTGKGAQLVEVLPADEYEWAHLPGSVNLPLKELDGRAAELDRSRPMVVYCHDWY